MYSMPVVLCNVMLCNVMPFLLSCLHSLYLLYWTDTTITRFTSYFRKYFVCSALYKLANKEVCKRYCLRKISFNKIMIKLIHTSVTLLLHKIAHIIKQYSIKIMN